VGSKLHGDFDRGYFSAWADCMRILSRIEVQAAPNQNGTTAEEERLATVKVDKSQATIENFITDEE